MAMNVMFFSVVATSYFSSARKLYSTLVLSQASDAYNFYTTGQNKIQAGAVSEGHELIAEALNLLNNVYGAMHGEIAQCLRMVARLCYVTGEHRDAMAYQQKAVLMSERVNGIDHPYTITEYVSILSKHVTG